MLSPHLMTPKQYELYDKVKYTNGFLSLQHNKLGIPEAQAIAVAIKENAALHEVHLGCNQIGEAGAQAIADALKVTTSVTGFHAHRNQIGDVGAQAIAEALKANTTITKLDLSLNQIGDVGALAIAETLKVNKTLTSVRLNDNFLTHVGISALRQTGNTICKFNLENQKVPPPAASVQMTGSVAATPQPQPSVNLAVENQQLRSELATKEQVLAAKVQELASRNEALGTKDQELATKDQELATKVQELQQLRSSLAAKDQALAAKDQELKSALDRIDVLERNQPAAGSASNFDGPIPQVPLATLVAATNNFAADSLLGEGAFGRVYDASLPGPRVAIKKLSAESKQGTVAFKSELDSLSKFRHANIIAILSYAEEGDERCLVYEFMPNGSVRDRLNLKNNTPPLTWAQRHKIAADVARGMHYVQTAFPDHALFHLDLKTDNVLLDAYFNAKVSDFGLVRAAQHLDDKSYLRTQNVQGTAAYMCPEFFAEGRMTIKTDVFAFGMILLELATAAKPGPRLKTDMRKAVKTQKFVEMLDSALKPSETELQSISELVMLAMECLDDAADDRPSFGSILVSLDP
ncbi:protein kinase [Capsaspora owczarzaki ATCC 30864]|uniref:TKL/IRAK protein kinase n=1 Tax=Capsaspora owczarzaki (strain ATCC 30864) TaxID=595528 RepID=A0A0D2UHC4_CAPO3|nr:protein kinase [Capsaspora owczarzaki ATCC 30864]KJE94511.1 TKL/IRAK protein kinase [Capsaspora owczarzaki ATCC 30864]|eukprot:XP_004346829.1 protein kinase [Capsaspora owczarzaki ATCC 30864]